MNLREIVTGQGESAGDVYLVVDFLQYELKEIQSGAKSNVNYASTTPHLLCHLLIFGGLATIYSR